MLKKAYSLFYTKWYLFFLLIMCILIYFLWVGRTFNAPFYFDDYGVVVDNNKITYIGNLFRFISDNTVYSAERSLANRGITAFTYALNYKLSTLSVYSYRFFNCIINLLCALILYLLAIEIIAYEKLILLFIGVFASLFFPGSLQPAVYINARSESLAFLLILTTMLFYFKTIKANTSISKTLFFLLSVIFAFLSFNTKETSFLLLPFIWSFAYVLERDKQREHLLLFGIFPFMLLVQYYFFSELPYVQFCYIYAILCTFMYYSFVWLLFYKIETFKGNLYKTLIYVRENIYSFGLVLSFLLLFLFIAVSTDMYLENRGEGLNFLSQLSLLPLLIFKIFLPYKQSIIHDFVLADNLFLQVLGMFLSLILLYALVFVFRKNKYLIFPLLLVFISLFVYLFIPLKLILNESRLFVPTLFFGLFLGNLLIWFFEKNKKNFYVLLFVTLITILFNVIHSIKYFPKLLNKEKYYEYAQGMYPDSLLIALRRIANLSSIGKNSLAYDEILKLNHKFLSRNYFSLASLNRYYLKNLLGMAVPIALRKGDLGLAAKNLEYLESFYPDFKLIGIYKAQMLLAYNKKREALALLRSMILSNKLIHHESFRLALVVALELNEGEKNLDLAKRAITLYYNDAKINYIVAQMYLSVGNLSKAGELCWKLYRLDKNYSNSYEKCRIFDKDKY